MKMTSIREPLILKRLPAILLGLGIGCNAAYSADYQADPATAEDKGYGFRLGGYVRTWASWNLQNVPETPQNDKLDLSMLRASLSLDMDAVTGPVQWKAIGRADREAKTQYLGRLENQNQTGFLSGGPGSHIMDQYNQAELREFYFDYSPTEQLHLRIGKQQVVWGESDFFHLTDLIHGFDFRWRSFLERDNDELRKPLVLLNGKVDVPEAKGTLQLVLRPALDRDRDIGNTFDLFGGRWALQPNKGVDFLAPNALSMNFHHPDGNANDVTGAVRWSGISGPVNYSFSYLRTFNPNPVVNSAFVPFKQKPVGALGDFIFPEIDVFGATVSGAVPPIDSVLSAEMAYQKGVPFNVGTNFFGGALPGFGGIMKKNVIVSSLRFDKQFKWMRYLGTSGATFFSAQLFDTWVQNYNRADDLVALAGFGAPTREHDTIFSGFITFNYWNNRLNPGLGYGLDVTTGDSFIIPSIEYQYGNHLRFVLESDLFFPNHQKQPGQVEMSAFPLGGFAHNNQLLLRITYQF